LDLLVVFLELNFGTELLQVLVSGVQDLHESGVLLEVDLFDPLVEVLVPQQFEHLFLFLLSRCVLLFLLRFEVGLDDLGFTPDQHRLFLVKFMKFLGVDQDLV
jgi:hypothetical protein